MVPLITIRKDEILQQHTLESMFLHYYFGYSVESFDKKDFSGQNQIAFKGYSYIKEDEEIINKTITRPAIKGIDYSNNIYCFIGIHLASTDLLTNEIDEKFQKFSLKNKFAFSLFFKNYENILRSTYRLSENDPYCYLLNLLFDSESFSKKDENIVFDLLTNNSNADAIDVILYDMLLKKFTSFKCNNMSSVDLIKNVFSNFQDAIKHITEIRRKDHVHFEINDEYDVQDLSYLVLRSVFQELEFENPHFKSGGTNSKVDLMLEKEGIDIELKMIKSKDKDEKDFIKQLKIDFNDYAAWKDLKDLIVFVYDPFNKTTNRNNFYSLQGEQSIRGVSFNVHIIVSN